ncbi:MAG: hypothetical protein J7M34_00285 [Anaerolineae bacterium]|nr:hypothetical protein [Anaerolineae bacterium]
MDDVYCPDHLKRHREVYERHLAGETYVDIARDMGISPARARQLALRWKRHVKMWHEFRRYREIQMGQKQGEATEFEFRLDDGRAAHCWRVGQVDCKGAVFEAGLVSGIAPEDCYIRIERGGEQVSTIFMRYDELQALLYVGSAAMFSLLVGERLRRARSRYR